MPSPASTDTSVLEEVVKLLPEDDPVEPEEYATPEQVGTFISAVSDAFTVVLQSVVNALLKIFTQGGILLVLILTGIGFMFVYWAIRLIHLRGR